MKKLITLFTLTALTAGSASAITIKEFADLNSAANKESYEAGLAFIQNVKELPAEIDISLESWKIEHEVNHRFSAIHMKKTREQADIEGSIGKDLFYKNLNKLNDAQIFSIAMRIRDYGLAAKHWSTEKKASYAIID